MIAPWSNVLFEWLSDKKGEGFLYIKSCPILSLRPRMFSLENRAGEISMQYNIFLTFFIQLHCAPKGILTLMKYNKGDIYFFESTYQ